MHEDRIARAAVDPVFVQRFWSKVRKGEGCWEWIGSSVSDGYGGVSLWKFGVHWVGAHRVSWAIAHGRCADGMWVLHTCDNRRCVRPEHLWIGNNADNSADRARKGRTSSTPGSEHWCAKLVEADIPDICDAYTNGVSRKDLAIAYGVRQAAIREVVAGNAWKHVPR